MNLLMLVVQKALRVFISVVIAASPLKELANIQITGKRKNKDKMSKIIENIQLHLFCFCVNILFSSLSLVKIFWITVKMITKTAKTIAIVEASPISQLTVPFRKYRTQQYKLN